MNNNAERDTKKAIDRLSTVSSSASSNTLDLVDKGAKKLSDVREERELRALEGENNDNIEDTGSRLKTSENVQETVNTEGVEVSEESTSRIKTNVNASASKVNVEKSEGVSKSEATPKTSKLKTSVSKAVQKTFKFNDNQGKISKAMTVVSKTGSKASKAGRTVTRTSRELNKAMSNDGTGTEYINDKIGRKVKTKSYKIAKKGAKKLQKKFNQTLGKKLVQVAKTVLIKLLKLLISIFTAAAEFIIPVALVVLIIVAICSIFGSGSSNDKSITDYSSYMKSVQAEYNKQVDDWKRMNPTGIVVGVKGEYGQIDWRIPLAIMQSTGAELSFDSDEKSLLDTFKSAGLYEKHEVVYQEVEGSSSTPTQSTTFNTPSTTPQYSTEITPANNQANTIPVLVITNGVYEDYLEWLNKNYSKIADFNKKKKVTDGSDTSLSYDQKEMLELLYQSDDFAELLGNDFVTHTPVYGKNETKADLKSDNYNSKNTLATSGFKGQCTWYSFGRALEISGMKMPTGNAQTWLTSAIAMGYKTGTQPSTNSVVVLMGHKYGHVAYVEAYDGKTITISEGNVGNKCSSDDTCSQVEYANEHAEELVRTKTYSSFDAYRKASKNSGLTVVGFIYLDKEKEKQ
ncbi:MAG: CHAP domain-containing protein [Bacilli bacterium]|nr:CHAP domain-containing protein [Bacilli bacterium]